MQRILKVIHLVMCLPFYLLFCLHIGYLYFRHLKKTGSKYNSQEIYLFAITFIDEYGAKLHVFINWFWIIATVIYIIIKL